MQISQASARRANTDDLKVTYQRKSKLTVEATCAAAAAAAAPLSKALLSGAAATASIRTLTTRTAG